MPMECWFVAVGSDQATLPFPKLTNVCLSPAVRVVICPCVVLIGPQCVIVAPCMAVKTSCPSPGQLKQDLKLLLGLLPCAHGWGLLLQCWSWIVSVPSTICFVCGQASVHTEHPLRRIQRWLLPGAVQSIKSVSLGDSWWSLKCSLAPAGWKVL